MTITHVNSASISAGSTAASAYSVALGTAVSAGDLIVVAGESTGTHVTNGMSVQDSRNLTNFTTLREAQQGGASSHWMQTFWFVTPQALLSTDTVALTPYASNLISNFSADVFHSDVAGTWSIDQAATGISNTASLTVTTPALGANATAGALVLNFVSTSTSGGTLTAASPFTAGSTHVASPADTGIGYVLSASGATTYASTWTSSGSNTSSGVTVSFLLTPTAVARAPQFTSQYTGFF